MDVWQICKDTRNKLHESSHIFLIIWNICMRLSKVSHIIYRLDEYINNYLRRSEVMYSRDVARNYSRRMEFYLDKNKKVTQIHFCICCRSHVLRSVLNRCFPRSSIYRAVRTFYNILNVKLENLAERIGD